MSLLELSETEAFRDLLKKEMIITIMPALSRKYEMFLLETPMVRALYYTDDNRDMRASFKKQKIKLTEHWIKID